MLFNEPSHILVRVDGVTFSLEVSNDLEILVDVREYSVVRFRMTPLVPR